VLLLVLAVLARATSPRPPRDPTFRQLCHPDQEPRNERQPHRVPIADRHRPIGLVRGAFGARTKGQINSERQTRKERCEDVANNFENIKDSRGGPFSLGSRGGRCGCGVFGGATAKVEVVDEGENEADKGERRA